MEEKNAWMDQINGGGEKIHKDRVEWLKIASFLLQKRKEYILPYSQVSERCFISGRSFSFFK